MIGLYIHIPFCDQKCAYCDFLSFPGRHSAQKAQYLDALCAEMRLRLRGRWQHPQTIFIGGGDGQRRFVWTSCERCCRRWRAVSISLGWRNSPSRPILALSIGRSSLCWETAA